MQPPFSGSKDVCYKDQTAVGLAYLWNGNSFTGKNIYLYWDSPRSMPIPHSTDVFFASVSIWVSYPISLLHQIDQCHSMQLCCGGGDTSGATIDFYECCPRNELMYFTTFLRLNHFHCLWQPPHIFYFTASCCRKFAAHISTVVDYK